MNLIIFNLIHNSDPEDSFDCLMTLLKLVIFVLAAPFMLPFKGGRRIWLRSFVAFKETK